MLIVCPSCATSYDVEPASLPPTGRQVRCVRCRKVWHAVRPQADRLLAAADAIAPARGAIEGAAGLSAKKPISRSLIEPPAETANDVTRNDAGGSEPTDYRPTAGDPSLTAPPDEHDPAAVVSEGEAFVAEPNAPTEVEAPPIVPIDLDEGRPPIDIDANPLAAESHEDIETIAARRHRRGAARRAARWPLTPLQTTILALVIIDFVLVGWRSDVVRAVPQTASLYALMGLPVNLRGLAFDGIATTTEEHEGVPILVVEGNIVNEARKAVDVPRLKFIVRNAGRQEVYSWTAVPSRMMLPPGETVSFRSRLASPPPDAHDVLVRFVNRRDIVAATR
jgi:predicted Zn finger-like uncharacterized protein